MCFDAFEGVFGREIYIYIYIEREREREREIRPENAPAIQNLSFFFFFFFCCKIKGLGVFIGQN